MPSNHRVLAECVTLVVILVIVMGSPVAHMVIGWLGAWYCYSLITRGRGIVPVYVAGFLAWSAAYHAFMTALNDAMIYGVLSRLGLTITS